MPTNFTICPECNGPKHILYDTCKSCDIRIKQGLPINKPKQDDN